MKYSVLMSVYKNDSPEFLKIALESTYDKQTRKPDEIVVVFDGPITQELKEVLDDFYIGKESFVFYYPQERNLGLGEALRIGSEKCSGDYILRMDSDDICHPTRFEKQICFLENHLEVDVLGSDIEEFQFSEEEENKRLRRCPAFHDDIVQMSKKRNPINHMTVCIKKTALEKAGGYKTLLLLEDYYLWLNMIVAGCKFANINETLVYARVGNGFEEKRGSKKRIKGWKVLQNLMLDNKMITKHQARMNMLYIRIFVMMPVWIKKLLYKKVLRK